MSAALAALRQDLGDPLFVRAHGGIALTPGGRALAEYAQDIVGLADQARWEVSHAQTDAGRLKIVATAPFAEHAAGRLLDLFTRRVPGASVDVVVEQAEDVASLLLERVYDIALGRPPSATAPPNSAESKTLPTSAWIPSRSCATSGSSWWPRGIRSPRCTDRSAAPELLGRPWFAGPAGIQETSRKKAGGWPSMGVAPEIVRLSSETEALAAVRAGEGIDAGARPHCPGRNPERLPGPVPVAGTPISGLWWASTLDRRRTTTMAQTLQRFAGTADATAAMVAPGGSRGLERRGSKFHVALWS